MLLIIKIILIFAISLILPLFYLWWLNKAKRRLESRLRRRSSRISPRSYSTLEVTNAYIGEISCRYNARSPYIRCAVNPDGPCENCSQYEAMDEDSELGKD